MGNLIEFFLEKPIGGTCKYIQLDQIRIAMSHVWLANKAADLNEYDYSNISIGVVPVVRIRDETNHIQSSQFDVMDVPWVLQNHDVSYEFLHSLGSVRKNNAYVIFITFFSSDLFFSFHRGHLQNVSKL